MTWVPVLVRDADRGGRPCLRLGHPLVDRYRVADTVALVIVDDFNQDDVRQKLVATLNRNRPLH